MPLRKLKLSFLAMLCGWIACNIAWWAGAIPVFVLTDDLTRDLMMVGGCTGIVVVLAWLVIFLPVDLCVRDDSKLRKPQAAALMGLLVSFSIVTAVYGYVAWFDGFWETLDKAALPYALGTCATGSVAAYIRAHGSTQTPG